MKKYGQYYATMGLEIHVALKTESKLFSRSENDFSTDSFALLDAGLPGVLPVLAEKPVSMAIAFALAVSAQVEKISFFERKHYFYPDLPLGYQITQQHKPIMTGGRVKITTDEGKEQEVQIEHAHLECDAAKSIHGSDYTRIDLARCASPLLEIVSMPCLHSPKDAREYAQQVHALVKFMDICDGKMEEGSFRVDASISLSKTDKLGTRVEIKNISSFSFLQTALEYEIERQTEMLDKGCEIVMETRLFDESSMSTMSMRKKETVEEYRYMPDPDILPLILTDEMIEGVKKNYDTSYFSLKNALQHLAQKYGMEISDGVLQSSEKPIWLEILHSPDKQTERMLKFLAFWLPEVKTRVITNKKISMKEVMLLTGSALQAKEIKDSLIKWYENDISMEQCIPQFMSDTELNTIIQEVIASFPEQCVKYRAGEQKMLQFIIGKVMVQVKGKAPATQVKQEVQRLLA